ncbi:MAG: prepilin-type N-terminal cleavage/methylation domain-containing protein [Candidatus Margulisiibacteriota bacterium]|jgi:prepilin-type N-terminal cleavage/methylation domain-containing protein
MKPQRPARGLSMKQGFTAIEMLMAMVVIGFLAAYAFLSLNPYPGIKLEAAVKKVAGDLNYTRNLALIMTEWYGITFEADPNNTYTVYKTDGAIDATITDPSGGLFAVNINQDFNGVIISGINIAGGKKLEFNPLGAPYIDKNGAAVSAEAIITLSFQGATKTIRITPNTGRIFTQ